MAETVASDSADTSGATAIQSLIWPENGICTERDLYVRLGGAAGLSAESGEVHFAPESTAQESLLP